MYINIKNIILALLIVSLFTHKKLYQLFSSFDQKMKEESTEQILEKEALYTDTILKKDYFINDSLYIWNDELFDWVVFQEDQAQCVNNRNTFLNNLTSSDPIEIDWQVLKDIKYKPRYFSEIEMEIYSPVFSKEVEALHEKTVIIEGFVVPFDEEEGFLSLSLNPFASCFFCGNASPASVISLYLKDKVKRYKIDAFKRFKGTLYLNQDDPNEFYYILRNAEVIGNSYSNKK